MILSHKLSALDRTIVFALGALLTLLGAWAAAILAGNDAAVRLANALGTDNVQTWLHQPWLPYLLAAVALITSFAGMWLVVINVRSHRFNVVPSPASDDIGSIEIAVSGITSGACQWLASHEAITKAERVVSLERGRPTVTFTLICDPETDFTTASQLACRVEEDLRGSLPGIDLDTVYRVHYDKLKPLSSPSMP